jgi:hypothetical protein
MKNRGRKTKGTDRYITEIDMQGVHLVYDIFYLPDCLLSWLVNGRCLFEDIGKYKKDQAN